MIFIILFGGMSGLLFLVSFVCAYLIEMFDVKGLKKVMKYSWITAFLFLLLAIISYNVA